MGIRFYAYREGGTIDELWRQFWEACDAFSLRDVYVYDASESNGDLTIYKFDGMTGNEAISVFEYLDETYPKSHWEISGL